MPITNFPNGFANGISLRGMPILNAYPGTVFWVDSVNGSNGNPGTQQNPFASVAGALVYTDANRGDILMVKPNHAETIANATSLILSKANVAIIGMGTGSARPTFTFTTAATANIPVTAANVTIQNCLFVANRADVASVFTVTTTSIASDFALVNCEFRDTSSILNFISIVTGNATAKNLDGLTIVGCRFSSLGTTAATTAVKLGVAADRMTITDNFGCWAVLNNTACMLAAGAFNCTNFEFARNRLERPNTASTTGTAISTSGTAWTGHAYDNYIYQIDASAGIWISTGTGGAFGFSNNFSPITGAVDKSGLINPVAV